MAKGRVSGGTGLNMVAKLSTIEAIENAKKLIKTLNDVNKAAKDLGVNPATGTAKAFDVKPLTEFQAGLLKIKQDALDLAKQNAAKAEERRNQLDAEKKAAQEKSAAEKSASLAIQAALKEETRIKKEQIALQKEQAALARKTGPIPAGFADRQFQNPVKLGSEMTNPTRQLMIDTIAAFKAGKISVQEYESEIVRLNKILQAKSSAEQVNFQSTNNQTKSTKENTESAKLNAAAKKELAIATAIQNLSEKEAAAALKNSARERNNDKGSLEQRRAALIRLTTVYDRLSVAERNSVAGTRMRDIIKGVTDQVKELEAATGRFGRNVGNYSGGIAEFFGTLKDKILSVLSTVALLTAAWDAAKAIFNHNVEISDNFVDVQRTAKLSADEVDRLGDKLKNINTRTSLEGLLEIGFIGGRLGVAKDDLVGFIKEVDELAVVLKKEFPGGAEAVATSLGKVISVYKITQKEGISLQTALRKTGSAILELSHNGGAPVKDLQEFALGTAGIAQIVKLSLPTLLAYGSVLSKAGINASTAATGVTRFLSDLSGKREKYFAIAQLADSTLTIEKFTNLINTDAKQALELFFKGLKSGNPTTTETGDRLKTLSLTAGKVKNTVIALSEAQDTLFTSTKLINKAYDEGTSSNHNFELANNSLSASIDKLKNKIANIFTSSSLTRSAGDLLNSLLSGKSAADELTEAYEKNKTALDNTDEAIKPVLSRYDELKKKGKLNTDEQKELRDIIVKIGEVYPNAVSKINEYGDALDINRVKIQDYTKAQRAFLELQNRSAISKSNEEFDDAQKRLPDAQKRYLSEKKNTKSNRVLGTTSLFFSFGKADVNELNENSQAAKDILTRLSERAYNAAKNVRDLGGTLTAVQKKILEDIDGKDKIKIIPATVLQPEGEGLNDENTIAKMKAELKTLILANSTLGTETKKFQDNLSRIKELKKEIKLANGGKDTEGISAERIVETVIKSRNNLQKEIDKMIAGSKRTQMNADEAEVSTISEKYDTLRQKAKEYYDELNKKIPKSKQVGFGLTLSGINSAELNEKQAAIDKGINERFKTQLANQTLDFEKVEDYRLKYGEDKARERFTKELNISEDTYQKQFSSAEAYAQKLEDIQTAVLNKYGDPSGYTDAQKQELDIATNELISFNDKKKALNAATYENIFQQVQSYQDKVNAADKKYLVNKKAIQDREVENGAAKTMKMIKLLDESYAAEVSSLSSDELMKSTDWTKLFGNLDELTITQIEKLIKTIEYQFNNLKLKFNPIDLKSIQEKLQEAKDLLIKENPFRQVGVSIKEVFSNSADGAAKSTEQIKREWTNLGKSTASSFAFINDAVNSCDLLKDALGEVGTQAISSLAAIAQSGVAIASAIKVSSAATKAAAVAGAAAVSTAEKASVVLAIISAALAAVQAISNIFKSIFNKHDKDIEKSISAHKQQIEELGYAYNGLERDIKNSVGKAIEGAQYKQIENLKAQQAELIKMRDEESQKKKADQGKISDYNNQIAAIPDKIKDIQNAINETLTATTSKSISDAIISGFKNGKRTAEDFADDFNGMMEDALLKALQTNYLDGAIAEFYKSFVDASKNGLTDAEVNKLREEYNAILNKAAEQTKDIDKITGGKKTDKPSSVIGGINNAGLTEDSANRLMGINQGTFDQTKRIANNFGLYYQAALGHFRVTVEIAENTKRTANNTDVIPEMAKDIKRLADSSPADSKSSLDQQLRNSGVKL